MMGRFRFARTTTSGLLAAALGGVIPAAAAELQPGERVRLTRYGSEATGTIRTLDGSELVLKLEGGASVTIPRRDFPTVEVSRGTRHRAAWGALAGALAGIVAASFAPTECGGFAFSSNTCKRQNGLAFGAVGAATGALIGWTIRVDKWQRVGGRQPQLRISMPKGGVGAQLKVKW